MKNWYVIKTKPKKEIKVVCQFKQAEFEHFYPQMRGVGAPKALFPSYLFLKADLDQPGILRMVQFTRGVSRILGDAEGPRLVPELIVQTLQERTRDGMLIEQDLLFKEGDPVIIKRGILKDLIGIIEKNLSDQGRVKVLFKWLNSTVRAVIKYRDLEKAA